MAINLQQLRSTLNAKVVQYNHPSFIATDPIQVPHGFTLMQDIEIAGFLAASIAWGNRTMIIKNAARLMEIMEQQPYEYVMHAGPEELKKLDGFVHRTFNADDAIQFVYSLRNIYHQYGSMEKAFKGHSVKDRIHHFRTVFFREDHLQRTEKHVSDPFKGSAAKRINMFLRWMVRQDEGGVDFGIWNNISPAELIIPLDVHSGRAARKLGLLQRKQNDWKAAEELTTNLRLLDPEDPVKYDYALFGMGVFEKVS